MKLFDFIVKTTLTNSSPTSSTGNAKFDTKDKVFLLSKSEYQNYVNMDNRLFPICSKATDYAILSGINVGQENYTSFYLRTKSSNTHSSVLNPNLEQDLVETFNFTYFNSNKVYLNYIGVRPSLYLDTNSVFGAIQTYPNSKFFKINEKNVGETNYHTITFGEFPKTVVSDKKLISKIDKQGKELNKVYFSNIDFTGAFINSRVKEFNGERYAIIKGNPWGNSLKLSNGKKVENNAIYYVKVEPISWCIINWNNLPKTINVKGSGKEKEMLLISEDTLFPMPFYSQCFSNFAPTPKNLALWQNSTIRGYLNGISVNTITTNGNVAYTAPNGGNFSYMGCNFLTQALNIDIAKIDRNEDNNINIKNIAKNGEKNMDKNTTNAYNFDLTELTNDDLLNLYIQSNTSVFLHGTSGVGKSARVKQIDPTATRITLRPQMNPEEIDGTLDRETGEYIPPLWYTQLVKKCSDEPNKKHVLFIDELTNVKPTVQSLVYSIVLDRAGKDGLWPLPENAVVVAAGNENADNLAAYPLTNALFRRFCHIYFEVNKENWLDWAMGVKTKVAQIKPTDKQNRAKIHPAILAFLMTRNESVLNQDLDEENPEIVTDPRKWEIASNVLYATNNPNALLPALGEDITADFVDFVKTCKITVKDILSNNYKSNDFVNLDISSKLSNIMSLTVAKEEELPKVRGFISQFFGKEILATFDTMWIRNDPERAQIISECEIDNKFYKSKNNLEAENNNHIINFNDFLSLDKVTIKITNEKQLKNLIENYTYSKLTNKKVWSNKTAKDILKYYETSKKYINQNATALCVDKDGNYYMDAIAKSNYNKIYDYDEIDFNNAIKTNNTFNIDGQNNEKYKGLSDIFNK